jgi:hypothetical protein
MARIYEPTAEQEALWKEFVSSRPEVVRKVAERFFPWELYRLKDTDQRVTMYSFSEDGTMSVIVSGQYNFTMFDRRVFGVDPDDLEPCDLPDEGEIVGTVLTEEGDVRLYTDAIRTFVLGRRGQ